MATSVHCRNNPRQTMISLSTDMSGAAVGSTLTLSICVPPTRRAARIELLSALASWYPGERWVD